MSCPSAPPQPPDPGPHAETWISVPGICHLPFEMEPHAGEVSLNNGQPVAHVVLGQIAGRDVVMEIRGLDWFTEAEFAFQLAHARLSMWSEDHRRAA